MNRLIIGFLLVALAGLTFCNGDTNSEKESVEVEILSLQDLQGQWKLVKIDTIREKQSIEQNETYNNYADEYNRLQIEPVDGVIQCVNCLENYIPTRTIEFSNDSVYEFSFPTRLVSKHKIEISENRLIFGNAFINAIWYESVGSISVEMSKERDKLYVSYLEGTGFYLKETFILDNFDEELVSLLKKYRENLPEASGKYALVHYLYEPVDYDSPFEHYHSFPYNVPETLDLSKEYLMEVLKNNYKMEVLTDGVLKPYELSWGWGNSLWIEPENVIYAPDSTWYQGPDTSSNILYQKVE